MDVLEAPSIEADTFAIQDVTFLVLGGLDYEQIIETARSSKIFVLSEAFWRAKVLSILRLPSMDVGRMYVLELSKDRDDMAAHYKANHKTARAILKRMDDLAAESILACRVPYVRVLYEMNPELLRTKITPIKSRNAGSAMRQFLRFSNNMDCIAAYGHLFSQDAFFREIATRELPVDARNAVGVYGKGSAKMKFDRASSFELLDLEEQSPESITNLFLRALERRSVVATDFRKLLEPKYLGLLVKNTAFYRHLLNQSGKSAYIKAKFSMLRGTSVCLDRPVHYLISANDKVAVKTWRYLGLPEECILSLQLARVDVTDEFAPLFMPLFHSKGHRARSVELENELESRTLLLCWLDQAQVEHSFRITFRTYRTLCDIIFRPSLHHQTAEYMKSLLASNLGTLQIFELYWTFPYETSPVPIGGSAPGHRNRKGVLRACNRKINAYITMTNDRREESERNEAAKPEKILKEQ